MPRGMKVRRIDYNLKEMMEKSEISVKQTFYNHIGKFYELYGFEKTDFKLDKSKKADYYFPADFAELLALILKNSGNHPFSRANHAKDKVNAAEIQKYNKLICEGIDNELHSVFRDLIYTMPSHLQSVKLGDLTTVLVERLTLFIVSITKLDHQGVGDAIEWLCNELDKANYNLFRGNFLTKIILQSNEEFANQHYKNLLDNLYGATNEKVDDLEKRMTVANNSIDYAIALLIKRILLGTDDLYYADKGKEFLDFDNEELLLMLGLRAVPADKNSSNKDENNYIERDIYYRAISDKVNHGRVAMAEYVLDDYKNKVRARKSIIDKIKDGSFREASEISIDEKKRILESQIKEMQDELVSLDADSCESEDHEGSIMALMHSDYLAYCEQVHNNSDKLKEIVDNFVGQVLINFMNTRDEE
ncbi:hypothetical protein [uncultured Brevibacillus sp.]|uniref:hypothetical protein n=1 Tax=uncultured Brevibacillus sp. TaxID=169970 RepID=UPI00259A60BC|nr:hypothetical protein [uncultured Brevibacillus sp.]